MIGWSRLGAAQAVSICEVAPSAWGCYLLLPEWSLSLDEGTGPAGAVDKDSVADVRLASVRMVVVKTCMVVD